MNSSTKEQNILLGAVLFKKERGLTKPLRLQKQKERQFCVTCRLDLFKSRSPWGNATFPLNTVIRRVPGLNGGL